MELALIGAPNTGKTTVFNALCKRHEKTGNFAGITVAPAYGKLCTDPSVTLVDLPGIYALATLSLEERVTRNYLQTQQPDGIVTVLDATHPEKSLALLLQLTPLGFPILAVFTMTDLLAQKGLQFSDAAFARVSGVPCLRADSLSPQTFLAAVRHALAAPPKLYFTEHRHPTLLTHLFCRSFYSNAFPCTDSVGSVSCRRIASPKVCAPFCKFRERNVAKSVDCRPICRRRTPADGSVAKH